MATGHVQSEDRGTGQSINLVDLDRLTGYLAAVSAFRDDLPIRSIQRIGHGQSNLTFRVTLESRSVVLRRPPFGPLPPRAHDVLREFQVLSGLSRSPLPVPTPLLACDDEAVLGAPFFLMEDLPGDAIRYELPPWLEASEEARHLVGVQVVDALATLHTVDPPAVGLGDLGRPTGYVERQLKRWKGQLDYARTRPVPDLDWTAEWLERNRPEDVSRASIVHGDYRLDNVIFSLTPPPRLLGVVDWELATLGDPLSDLGWLLAFWCEDGTPPADVTILPRVMELPGFPRRAELAQRYAERVGRTLPDLRFYVVFALWRMAVLLEAHWARHVAGTAGAFNFAYLEHGNPAFAAYIRSVAEER